MAHAVVNEKGRKYVGLPEFAQAGGRVLAEMELEQARGTVTSVPDEVADFRTIEFVKKFVADAGIKPALHHYGVKEAQLDALTAQAFEDACHLTNPVPVNSEDLKDLYRLAL